MSRPAICLSVSTYPPQPGGVAAAAARVAGYLAGDFEVHVIVPEQRAGAGGVETTQTGDATVHRVYHDEPPSAAAQFQLRQVMQALDDRHDFRLFHGFFLTAAVPCIYAAMRRKRPTIASARGSDVAVLLEQPVIRTVLLAALRSATWITSLNQAGLDRIAEEVPVTDRSSVIRLGVTPPGPDEPRWQVDPARRGVVGTVGEFRAVKDIPLLIRAYATVPAPLRRRLYLGGFFSDKDEKWWSETLLRELSVESETTLTGQFPPEELPAHLARLHVYVQASANEGGPNAVLEAAARGIPIVATAVGGMREVLAGGASALLVPHGNRDMLGAAIRQVLADDRLAASLSAGALDLAARMSFERERAAWLALYEQLLGA